MELPGLTKALYGMTRLEAIRAGVCIDCKKDAQWYSPAGKAEYFTNIFRAHHGHVSAYVRRRVSSDGTQDIVANTFFAAWRHIDELPENPLPWLYRAASFEIANWRRSQDRLVLERRSALTLLRGVVTSDTADDVAWADRWTAAFAFLTEADREVLRLVAWENLTSEDAAVVLGCSTTAFKVRLHRARSRLVHLVDAEEDAPSVWLKHRVPVPRDTPSGGRGRATVSEPGEHPFAQPNLIHLPKEVLP